MKKETVQEPMDELIAYAKIRLELIELKAVDKVSSSGSYLLSNLLIFSLFFIAITFLSLAAGLYLSKLMGSVTWAFALVGGCYIFFTLILFLLRKHALFVPLKNKIISALTDNEKPMQ